MRNKLIFIFILFISCASQNVRTGKPDQFIFTDKIYEYYKILSPQEKAALSLVNQARDAIMKRQLNDAGQYLERATSLAPNNFFVQFFQAYLQNLEEKPDVSLQLLKRAKIFLINDDRWKSEFYLATGDAYSAKNNKADAIAHYKLALSFYPAHLLAKQKIDSFNEK